MSAPPLHREYVLGHAEYEVDRLIAQADLYLPMTARLFQEAGIAKGARVLDLGCGPGDVSFLAAEIVGRTGTVVGVDRASAAVEIARQRALRARASHVSFECQALDRLSFAEPFDVVVGRCILLHQPDPAGTVRQAAKLLKEGGLIVFQEQDFFSQSYSSWPSVPLLEKCVSWIHASAGRCGIQFDMGKKLHKTFISAGLPAPEMRLERLIGSEWRSAGSNLLAQMVRTFLPQILEFGIATARDIEIETLARRIESELIAADAIVVGSPLVGAWSHKPRA